MANKMLIDAAHPEETRVVVLRGNRIEEFDFEAANKKQLRGNIYLAKVTRVEPSLQAAFIEYGGNRHGFLAFAEIHPDYYQIPVADRQALLEEEARSHAEEDDDHRPAQDRDRRRSRRHRRGDAQPAAARRAPHNDETVTGDEPAAPEGQDTDQPETEFAASPDEVTSDGDRVSSETDADVIEAPALADVEADGPSADEQPADPPVESAQAEIPPESEAPSPAEDAGEHEAAFADDEDSAASDDEVTTLEGGREASIDSADEHDRPKSRDTSRQNGSERENASEEESVEQFGGDALEDVPRRPVRSRRQYKIQEVIKRRQVLLVQVVKEERGNKGAALTTYLSLAGRYSVLMPNTARGGGISRKITDAEDRKRLKAIAQELEVPDGMGIILRTAGAARGMPEVKRDFEYLMRMWETVRETTLKSSAPTLVYEEGSLIKRSIRDLFNKDVDEVIVAGEEAYREAKEFMRLLMPGQAKAVVPYRDPQPIFAKAGAEAQLDAMFSNQVTLRSGGYLVINQTEALVAIDVNSGRSTREHNIEDTALRTNLEAADEIARQLRLRDLAGLIVVDFIDMEEGRNDRAVERRLKDALKNDRARIQIGRISHFGLLEMSRQRMRTGVLEGSSVMCPHCAGSGTVRSISSIALHVLRLIEDALIKSAEYNLVVRSRSEVALYMLNQKRLTLLDLESRFGVAIAILADVNMTGAVYHAIERGTEATPPAAFMARGVVPPAEEVETEDEAEDLVSEEEEDVASDETSGGSAPARTVGHAHSREPGPEGDGRRRRRRRRRRGGRDDQGLHAGRGSSPERVEGGPVGDTEGEFDQEDLTDIAAGFAPAQAEAIAEAGVEGSEEEASDASETPPLAATDTPAAPVAPDLVEDTGEAELPLLDPVDAAEPDAADAPRRRRSRRTARTADAEVGAPESTETEPATPAKRPRRSRARPAEAAPVDAAAPSADRDVGADTAQNHTEALPPGSEPELPLPAAMPAAEPAAPPEAEPEADRPKRSGWWQRAKATFST